MPLIAMVVFSRDVLPTNAVDWLGTNIGVEPFGAENVEYLYGVIS